MSGNVLRICSIMHQGLKSVSCALQNNTLINQVHISFPSRLKINSWPKTSLKLWQKFL